MKICVGIKSCNNIEKYIDAGADEFFCGVISESWVSKYGYAIGINRRPWPSTNLSNFDELRKTVKKSHSHNCKVFFTINEHCYTNEQMEIIDEHVAEALECGVDAIIFSDPGLISFFYDKYKCEIHLSTGGTVFNQWSAKFFRDELKVRRIIMPREVTVQEIESIINGVNGIEYEAFILNEGCINIDGFCNHTHGLNYISTQGKLQNNVYSSGCLLKYDIKYAKINGTRIKSIGQLSEKLFDAVRKCGDCGICALYFLKDIGVTSLKLTGRASEEYKVINDVRFLKEVISLSNEAGSFQEFYEKVSELKCKRKSGKRLNSCYYPDLLRLTKNE